MTRIRGSNIGYVEAVTPDDAASLGGVENFGVASSLYVGVAGDVAIRTNGQDITFVGLANGWHPMPPFDRVLATGTTATDLIAGY